MRLTGEVVGERRGARERAEGRLGVEVERVPDADRSVWARALGRPGLWIIAVWAVAGARSRDCRGGEGGEGGGEEGEELHGNEDSVVR